MFVIKTQLKTERWLHLSGEFDSKEGMQQAFIFDSIKKFTEDEKKLPLPASQNFTDNMRGNWFDKTAARFIELLESERA